MSEPDPVTRVLMFAAGPADRTPLRLAQEVREVRAGHERAAPQ